MKSKTESNPTADLQAAAAHHPGVTIAAPATIIIPRGEIPGAAPYLQQALDIILEANLTYTRLIAAETTREIIVTLIAPIPVGVPQSRGASPSSPTSAVDSASPEETPAT